MNEPVPGPGAARVLAFCEAAGVRARILREPAPMPTVEAAAAALGVEPAAIVKTLVYRTRRGEIVLAIAAGLERVDARAVAALAGGLGPLWLVPPAEVEAAIGYPAGACPPIAHAPRPRAVVVDEAVLARALVYGGGGDVDAMVEIAPGDIVKLTSAVVGAIRRGGAGKPGR